MTHEILTSKKAIVFGVANKRSLAYAIAEEYVQQGAQIIVTYQNESFAKRVNFLAENLGVTALKCDVLVQQDIDSVFEYAEKTWGYLDILVHSIAYAPNKEFDVPFHKTSKEGFLLALESSVYSFIAISNKAHTLMKEGGSIITLTFSGAKKVMPTYKVMGPAKAALESAVRYLAYDFGSSKIRVNAISAGPIKTLSSSIMPSFNQVLSTIAEKAPLKENVTAMDVANSAVYLASSLSSKVTGNIIYVDSGIDIMGA